MKEGLPVDAGAGRIEYKMNESNSFDGVDIQVRDNNGNDKRNRLIAGALTVAIGLTTPAVAAFADGPSSTGESQIKVTDTLKSQEVKSISSSPALVFQLNNPYYATFDKAGNYQIQKSLISPKLINGEVFGLTTKIAENLGYKTTQNEPKKTTIYKNNERQITFKNGSRIINILDLKTKRLTNITAKNAYQYNKDRYLCKGSESLFLTSVGKNSLYGSTNISKDFKEFLQKVPEGGGFQIKDMSVVLSCLEPGVDYGTNRDKMTTALEKYKVFPVALNNTKTACVSESLYNKTWGELKKDNSRFKLIGALDLLDEEVAKKLGIEEKYKADKNLVMLYKDENQTISFRKDIKTGLAEGWKLINGKEVKVAMNKETRKFEEVRVVEKMSQEKAIDTAKQYITGGEFWGDDVPCRIEVGATNVVRVYSSKEVDANEKVLMDKVEKLCKPEDVMCYWEKENKVCVLNKGSQKDWDASLIPPKMRMYDNLLKCNEVVDSTRRWSYFPDIFFDSNLGVCLSDGYRLTHRYDVKNKKFIELKDYKMLGTEEQRVNKTVKMLQESDYYKGRYEKTVIVNDSRNKPAVVLLQGGEAGMSEKYVQAWKDGIERLNEIDPEMLRLCVDKYGLNIIRFATLSSPEDVGKFAALLGREKEGGVIHYNQTFCDQQNYSYPGIVCEVFALIIVESRGLYDEDHYIDNDKLEIDDKVIETDSVGIEKQAYAIVKIEEYAGIPESKRLKLDPKKQIHLVRSGKLYDLGFDVNIRKYGRLDISEFILIQDMANSYDAYID